MTLDVQSYDPQAGIETEACADFGQPWEALFFDVESARNDLLDAVDTREMTRMPTSLPQNSLLRTLKLVSWVAFKRGVPPRGPTLSIPSFDPGTFFANAASPGWEHVSGGVQLSPRVIAPTTRAMSRLTLFVEPEQRASWTLLLGVLRDLHGRGQTLRCAWLED